MVQEISLKSTLISLIESMDMFNYLLKNHHIRWDDAHQKEIFDSIPIECFVLHLADRIDILIDPSTDILTQVPDIISKINSYSGTCFAPWCVDGFNTISIQDNFWLDINYKSMEQVLNNLGTHDLDITIDERDLEALALTFSRIVDFRSHFNENIEQILF